MNKTKKKDILLLIICILIPLTVGLLSARIFGGFSLYESLEKPPLSPPAALFPIVWTILYILMGISSYIILKSRSPGRTFALKLYAANLFFNLFWPLIFFEKMDFFFALIWLIIMFLVVLWMTASFFKIEKCAGLLNIPYILWLIFAGYLNFMVFLLN